MPLVKINIAVGRAPDTVDKLADVVHAAVLKAFGVPERDRYQIVLEHKPGNLRALDTGLGFERTNDFVLIEVLSRPRTREQKTLFYALVAENLEEVLGMKGSDIMFSFSTNSDEDWSFGEGKAQFLTGDL